MIELPTIAEASPEIRAPRLQSAALVDACLERIERYDGALCAWVTVDAAGARRAADALDREAAEGRWRGPLHGIPIGIKDIIDVAGLPTRAGSPLRAEHVAAADAPLVARLRAAGAVILGKTVTVEFACFDPSPTRNPWNAAHTPGGSSSGSAAAVAARMCMAAVGTQTGGSLVRPSAYCGVATFKPTYGRIDVEGVVPVSWHLDTVGPIARRVDDLAMLTAVMAGETPPDPQTPLARPPRLGLVMPFFMEQASPGIRDATEVALARLRAAGAEVEQVTALPDGFEEILDMQWRIMAVDAAAWHRETFPARRAEYGPMIATLLDDGLATAGVDFAAALAHQRAMRRRLGPFFAGFDALIAPATDTTAPRDLATTGPRTFQAPWSYLGVPVAAMPCGLAEDGMPSAVQLTAPLGADDALVSVARWCEAALGFSDVPARYQ